MLFLHLPHYEHLITFSSIVVSLFPFSLFPSESVISLLQKVFCCVCSIPVLRYRYSDILSLSRPLNVLVT